MSVTCRGASFTARKEKPHFTQVRLSTLFNPHHNKSRPHVSVYIFAFSLQTVERWHEGVIGLQIPLLVAFKAEAVKPEDKCSPQINIWLCSECFPLVYTSPNLDLRLKIVHYETFVQKHDMQPFCRLFIRALLDTDAVRLERFEKLKTSLFWKRVEITLEDSITNEMFWWTHPEEEQL